MNVMETKQEFIKIYHEHIQREGSDKLLEWLEKSDFFTAPASSKFHCAFEGGLAYHSINVFKRLVKLIEQEYGDFEQYPMESIAICGLLHDLCKVDFYKVEERNVKVNNAWTKVPYFAIDEKLPYGHGEKSVYIINGFIRLSREEAMAINWHMGGFDQRVMGGSYAMNNAFSQFPLCVLTHISDMMATNLDED